jgi:molybdenum cofactor biosynthesis enzyme MoaA
MKDRKYFCYEIYKNLAIWSHNGRLAYSPCSFFNGHIKKSDSFDLESIWNGPERAELKRCVETDTPIPGCRDCYKAEEHGLVSRRMASQQLYEEFHNDVNIELDAPQGLDYTVGNLCNLKCVICGPEDSSAWISDYQKLHPLRSIDQFKYEKFKQLETFDPKLLKNIKSLHIHGGGEPLMSNNHINLLKEIKKVKGLGDIRVFYNTNATQRASQELLELWKECQLIELYFSIDDTGNRFNYQRTGADWNTVTDNVKWYVENMPHNHMFNINCTWSYLNLYYLTDLVDWYQDNLATNCYGDTVNLIFQRVIGNFNILHLSDTVKTVLIERFSNYPQLIKLVNSISTSNKNHQLFWNEIEKIDQVRHSDYKKLCPEWSQLL